MSLDAFYSVITKEAMAPMVRPGSLRRASQSLMKLKPTKAPRPGTFGIKTSMQQPPQPSFHQPPEYEKMDRAKWKQTAKDLPLVILAGGAGYGLGKTLGDAVGESLARRGFKAGPGVRAWAPAIGSGLSAGAAYLMGRTQEELRQRRMAASANASAPRQKRAGVAPAPQSRGIPQKKRSDPWRYDPRPAAQI